MKRRTVNWAATLLCMGFLSACSTQDTVTLAAGNSTVAATGLVGIAPVPPRKPEITKTVYLTGYSYWDNTPPGSAAIAHPVIRRKAGGTGTYDDPITIAVGHVKRGQRSTPDYRPGTRFYVEYLRKYAIVEDVCGDGPRPQNGPCHIGNKGYPWLDIWVGGRNVNKQFVQRCMYNLTGFQRVIMNPRQGYPVEPGEISASGCRVFGNPTS